ncbi:MAG TPA: DUF4412 domain-containing protein [Chitinophagaceae bacterium]|nr:DUF4412 domain-containing protein [Chitinophagaceae bacterium]
MKNLIFFLLIGVFLNPPVARFNGVLHYENDYDMGGATGKILTTIYEADSKLRVESENIQTKTPIGQPGTKEQDVLLFDIDKQQETHLHDKVKRAIVTPYEAVLIQEQKMMDSLGITVTVQNLGNEKLGNYNCTHFVMITANPKIKSTKAGVTPGKKDIWITKDLGSCHVWYVGSYLYYPEGTYLQKKLADAGADGVVVKWQTGSGVMLSTCTLVSYENKSLPSSDFKVPADYNTVVPPGMSSLQKN